MSRLRATWKWLYPGMHVKRWIALGFVGLILFLLGGGVLVQAHAPSDKPLLSRLADALIAHSLPFLRPTLLGATLTLLGAVLCLFAFAKLIASLTSVLDPEMTPGGLVDLVYQRRKLAHGRRIVVLGGGTGLSTMLRGLKQYSSNITAIVTVADDGGSSGKIQKQLHILPPGDIRNCLVALADAEPQMTELFQYRFRDSVRPDTPTEGSSAERGSESSRFGEGLRDHAFGNLLIAAMCAINGGDFERAIQETSRVLNIRGQVLPSTVEQVRLRGEMEDGSVMEGETAIAHSPLRIKRISLVPGEVCPAEDVLEALARAEVIVVGPGSVFTSLIPNLLVRGIPEALRRSEAKKVYVCNVMTQPGETDGFSAYDHLQAIEGHVRLRLFDYVLVNTGRPSQGLLEKYRQSGSVLVEADVDRIKRGGYRAICGNFINQTDVVRHDASLLAQAIMKLLD
jgi:uncharacterized cofD-like protein